MCLCLMVLCNKKLLQYARAPANIHIRYYQRKIIWSCYLCMHAPRIGMSQRIILYLHHRLLYFIALRLHSSQLAHKCKRYFQLSETVFFCFYIHTFYGAAAFARARWVKGRFDAVPDIWLYTNVINKKKKDKLKINRNVCAKSQEKYIFTEPAKPKTTPNKYRCRACICF